MKKLCLFLLIALLLSCGPREPKVIPGENISGIKTTISRILISQLAFDSAIVAVDGFARDVRKKRMDGETVVTFRITDLKGNYINVTAADTWDIIENDALIVGGVYRKVSNEIKADQVEKIVVEPPAK